MNNNERYNGFSVRGVCLEHSPKYTISKEQLLFDLYKAFYDARKRKSKKSYVKEFEKNLHQNLSALRDELYYRTYSPRPLTCFVISYPKKREIFASEFIDRIVHHLYYNYLHEYFERTFIYDCYSCIKGRGTSFGIERLKHHIRSASNNYKKECYGLKLDISSYFMSINRKLLLDIVLKNLDNFEKKCHTLDFELLKYLSEEIILHDPTKNCIRKATSKDYIGMPSGKRMSKTKEGYGLPIGNLTSQLFSNVFLNLLDQYIKRELKFKHYGRYVDDLFIISTDKAKLLSCIPQIETFLNTVLDLKLNNGKTILNKVKYGVEFLGGYVKPHGVYISNQCLRRMKTKMKENLRTKTKDKVIAGNISQLGLLKQFKAYNIAKKLFYE